MLSQAPIGSFPISSRYNLELSLFAETVGFTTSGYSISFLYNKAVIADSAGMVIGSVDIDLLAHRILSLATSSYAVQGTDADVLYDRVLGLAAAGYSITTTAANFIWRVIGAVLDAEGGSITATGQILSFLYNKAVIADVGSVSISELLYPSLLSRWLDNVTARSWMSQQLRTDAFVQDQLTAFDMGPVELGDTSQSLYGKAWKLEVSNRDVYLYKASGAGWELEQYLFTTDSFPTSSLDLTFDQNGRPFACWEETGSVWIYYYDPNASGMTKWEICSGRTPRAKLDVRRDRLSNISDILLFYLNDSADCLEYRLQSDRYATTYQFTGFSAVADKYLELLAMSDNQRLYLWYSEYDSATSSWSLSYWHSNPYPYVARDVSVVTADDAILDGSVVKTMETAEAQYENIASAGDSVLSALVKSVMLQHEVDYEKITTTTDNIQSGSVVTVIIVESAEDESIASAGDSISSSSVITTMITTTAEDESIGSAGDSIQGATVA